MSTGVSRVLGGLAVFVVTHALVQGYPSVYPTGTTIYEPGKTWSGYTAFGTPDQQGTVVVDMNGREVKRWTEVAAVPGPMRVLPGGYVMGGDRRRRPHQEARRLVQVDWNGKVVWSFDQGDRITDDKGVEATIARQHHDWQREGNPVGYFAPATLPLVDRGRTLVLSHKNVTVPAITDKQLEDDRLHRGGLGRQGRVGLAGQRSRGRAGILRGGAHGASRRSPTGRGAQERRLAAHQRGFVSGAESVVRRRRPPLPSRQHHGEQPRGEHHRHRRARHRTRGLADGAGLPGDAARCATLGQIVGQHHPHIIPKGLPGAGHLLVFDNGGIAGYGAPNPAAPTGRGNVRRINSRVLEVNPVTFEKVWEYSIGGQESVSFFSHYVSSAQRLPNGNTMVTEGWDGRILRADAGEGNRVGVREPIFQRTTRPGPTASFARIGCHTTGSRSCRARSRRASYGPTTRRFACRARAIAEAGSLTITAAWRIRPSPA